MDERRIAMNRLFLLTALIGGLMVAGEARAQPPAPRPLGGAGTPPVSPYLNLLRGGTNPGINYYGIVRPEMAFQNAIQGMQGQLWQTQQALNQQSASWETTGHPVSFMNHGSYFMTTGIPARGSAGGTAGPARPALGGGFGAAPARPSPVR